MKHRARSYQLTADLVAAHAGATVLCLAREGMGRTYGLHAVRPDARLNRRVSADLPSGAVHVVEEAAEKPPPLVRVVISGPIEQRAGYHDPCAGWSDGNDAIAERLCAAFAEGDVLLQVDSPGGVVAGSEQGIARAVAAKAKYGRRCTGFADELSGSLAVMWSMAVCDEIFLPPHGQIGSIGAKAAHGCVAGALEKEGIAVTWFEYPPGKTSLAPEKPLDEEGRRRADRDVRFCAEAFMAIVCAGPLGQRRGLTPEFLVALGADVLTGQAAVDAGLADGVASLEEVTSYALTMAASAGGRDMPDDEKETKGEKPDEKPEGEAPDSPPADKMECGGCHAANPQHAKFCMGCGASMVAADDDDEAPPSSKPKPSERSTARVTAPRPARAEASLASILGAAGDSPLALRTAAISLRDRLESAIARADVAETSLASSVARAESQERWDLAHRANKTGKIKRDKIFADVIDEATGKRVMENGKPKIRIRSTYATMPLATFRKVVADLESDAQKETRDPFEPDRDAARAASEERKVAEGVGRSAPKLVDGAPTAAQIAVAKKSRPVLAQFNRPDNRFKLDDIAAEHVRTCAELGMPIGGAA